MDRDVSEHLDTDERYPVVLAEAELATETGVSLKQGHKQALPVVDVRLDPASNGDFGEGEHPSFLETAREGRSGEASRRGFGPPL